MKMVRLSLKILLIVEMSALIAWLSGCHSGPTIAPVMPASTASVAEIDVSTPAPSAVASGAVDPGAGETSAPTAVASTTGTTGTTAATGGKTTTIIAVTGGKRVPVQGVLDEPGEPGVELAAAAVAPTAVSSDGAGLGGATGTIATAASVSAGPTATATTGANIFTGDGPLFLVTGPDGNVWFTNFAGDSVNSYDPATQELLFYGLPVGDNPTRITVGPDGEIWFAETGPTEGDPNDVGPTAIAEITTDGLGSLNAYALPVADSDPTGVALGPDGNVWFTENATADVRNVTAEGLVSSPAAASTSSAMPTGIVNGPDGNLWYAETGADKIARLTPAGVLTEFPVTAGSEPVDLVVGNDGELYFTEWLSGKIGKMEMVGTSSNAPAFFMVSSRLLPAIRIRPESRSGRIAISGLRKPTQDSSARLTIRRPGISPSSSLPRATVNRSESP